MLKADRNGVVISVDGVTKTLPLVADPSVGRSAGSTTGGRGLQPEFRSDGRDRMREAAYEGTAGDRRRHQHPLDLDVD